ncbi:YagK/YfjJ domain-containing protein [Vibrio navarrensis]
MDYPLHPETEYITQYLDKLKDLFDNMLHQYKRVYYIRFDLRFPENSEASNNVITPFFDKLTRKLKLSPYHQTNATYYWVREISESTKPHYHCILLLDYNKTKSAGWPCGEKAGGIMKLVNQLWSQTLKTDEQSLIHLCKTNPEYSFINRDNRESQEAIFKHCSYLCKRKTKAFNLKGRNIGCSQVRNKNEQKAA